MSDLVFREQLRVAKALKVGMEIEAEEVSGLLEAMEADHQAVLELSSDLSVLSRRLDGVRTLALRAFFLSLLAVGVMLVLFS